MNLDELYETMKWAMECLSVGWAEKELITVRFEHDDYDKYIVFEKDDVTIKLKLEK